MTLSSILAPCPSNIKGFKTSVWIPFFICPFACSEKVKRRPDPLTFFSDQEIYMALACDFRHCPAHHERPDPILERGQRKGVVNGKSERRKIKERGQVCC
jgi:hypothetical protein